MAQALDASLWVTDGDVRAIAPWGNTIYVGGDFSYIGANTGGMVELDGLGRARSGLPRVDGNVTVSVSDGAGGWFIAGTFTHVAGIARPGLARVLADGSVSAWSPSPAPSGSVACLEHQGTRLFVATTASTLVAYDDATGARVGGWAPAVTGLVTALAVNGTTLFAGGSLSFTITSPPSTGTGIAAINTSTGTIENWDPAPDADVTKLQIDGRWLYVTGNFTSIGGQSHPRLARALLATKGFDSGWNPDVDAPVTAMAIVGDKLWIGGEFFFVNGLFSDRIATVDTTSGGATGFTPLLSSANGLVSAIVPHSHYVYLGLSPYDIFPTFQGAAPMVIRMEASSGSVDDKWRALGIGGPLASSREVSGLRVTPGGLFATGKFISVGGRRQACVAAFDRGTGVPRAWNPGISSTESFPNLTYVAAIAPTHHGIYFGGHFTHVGGQPRASLAAVDSARGFVTAWRADLGSLNPPVVGSALALALHEDKLIVGGSFTSIAAEAHSSLAKVDTVAGTPVSGWAPNVTGNVQCLLVRGTTLFAGGAFGTVNGAAHASVAALNASTGGVLAWNPNVQGNAVQALAASGDTLYLGGDYSNVGGPVRLCLAMVSASAGTLFGWAPAAFGPVRALWLDGPDIVVGGEYEFIVGQPVKYLARLNRITGALIAGTPVTDAKVLALAGDSGKLYIGGSFGQMGSSPTAYVARVGGADGAGPSVTVVAANGGEYLVVGTTYRYEYSATDPSGVASVDVELSRTGAGGPWTLLAAGLHNNGEFDWVVTAPNAASNAFLRVTARDFAGNVASDASNTAFSIGAPTTSVGPRMGDATLVLGPNPARLRTELRFTLQSAGRARFQLLDVQGRQVWASSELELTAGEHVYPVDLREVRAGLYFMHFQHGGGLRTTRLVVIQ